MLIRGLLLTILTLHAAPLWAQAEDVAAQRTRMANERIQLEAERRAAEEAEREKQLAMQAMREQEAAARQSASEQLQRKSQAVATPPPSATTTTAAGGRVDLSKTLDQIRTLGELRDAGYLSADEFERLKKKILDDTL